MKTLWNYAALLLLALFFISCEKEKSGLIDPSVQTPYLGSVSVSPFRVNLDSVNANVTQSGTRYTVRFAVAGSTLSGGGPAIQRISYKIFAPGETSSLRQGTLRSTTSGDTTYFSDSVSVVATRNDIGLYTLEVTAANTAGTSSGTRRLSFQLTRLNSKPRLFNLVAPDTIFRPAHGYTLQTFSVSAADSDGYTDIVAVSFRRIAPAPGGRIDMFDDGDITIHGDRIAGDGIFSRTLSIDSTARLGAQTFLFEAEDKSGAISDTLLHTITIVQ